MKKSKILIYCMTIILICTSFLSLFVENKETEAGNLIVVLDAGHDNVHAGASGNKLREEYLNLQIALACKNELETYEGVTVYMVRDNENCPYGGAAVGNSVACNKKRVEFAKSVGADVYVSLHNNSSTNKSVRGAGVYYPTTNYNYQCGVTGEGLARSILNQLLTTGLQNRGVSVRYSEDNTRYPDGSLADYYAIIKNNKLNKIPAIIVEHAFVSNAQDAGEYLSTYSKMWALGTLDAKGIAQYYGLQKKVVVEYSNAKTSAVFNQDGTQVTLQTVNVTGAEKVRFAVWSAAGGSKDLQWYDGVLSSGSVWKADVPIKNHGFEGGYQVHVYANDDIFVGETTFQVDGPKLGAVSVSGENTVNGSFVLDIQDVKSGAVIDSVSAAVWNKENPSEIKWIPAVLKGNGQYQLTVNISSFGYCYGEYQIDTYVRDKNSIVKCLNSQSYLLKCPEITMDVTGGAVSMAYQIVADSLPYGNGISKVEFWLYPARYIDGSVAEATKSAVEIIGETAEATKSAVEIIGETAEATESAVEIIGEPVKYQAVQSRTGEWRSSVYPLETEKADIYKVQVIGTLSTAREVLLGETLLCPSQTEQQLTGQLRADGKTLWMGDGIEILSPNEEREAVIKVNPWCDYKSVKAALDTGEGYYKDYIAFELEKTPENTPLHEITIELPSYMQQRTIKAFQVVTGDAMELIPLEADRIEETERVQIKAVPNGIFVIVAEEERIYGDADFNQRVELKDALLVLRAALNIEQLDARAEKFCDVNGDEVIDLKDAWLILQRALAIITDF